MTKGLSYIFFLIVLLYTTMGSCTPSSYSAVPGHYSVEPHPAAATASPDPGIDSSGASAALARRGFEQSPKREPGRKMPPSSLPCCSPFQNRQLAVKRSRESKGGGGGEGALGRGWHWAQRASASSRICSPLHPLPVTAAAEERGGGSVSSREPFCRWATLAEPAHPRSRGFQLCHAGKAVPRRQAPDSGGSRQGGVWAAGSPRPHQMESQHASGKEHRWPPSNFSKLMPPIRSNQKEETTMAS